MTDPVRYQRDTVSLRIHKPSPIYGLPTEILRMVFLELSVDALRHQTCIRSQPVIGWIAITHVCSVWRHIALEYPELWTSISRAVAPNHGWLLVFFDRSCQRLLDIEMDEGWYEPPSERLRSNLHRIRNLTLGNGIYLRQFPLNTSMPMLEKFCITKEEDHDKFGPSVIPNNLFAGIAPRLRTLQLPFGYELPATSPLLPHLRHLSLEHRYWSIPSWIDLLRRTSILEAVSLSLVDECVGCKNAHEDHSDVIYHGIAPIALPNLRLLTVSSGCPYELDTFFGKISFNPDQTTFIRPTIVTSGLGDDNDYLVDTLSGLVDHTNRPQIEPHEYLSISLVAGSTDQFIDYRGWRTDHLEKTWCLATHGPTLRPTVRFSRSFTGLKLDEAPPNEPSGYAPFAQLSAMCEHLPTPGVLALWLSMSTEGIEDGTSKSYNSVSGWRSFFGHFEGVEILRVSGPYGLPEFLSALTRLSVPSSGGADGVDDNPFLFPQHHLHLFLPCLKEIVVGDLGSRTDTPLGRKCVKETYRSLFRFLRQRYLSNAALDRLYLSSGLCPLVCNSEEKTGILSYYVEDSVSCLECGRSWHGSKNLGSHDRKIEIFVWLPDGIRHAVRVDPEHLVHRLLTRLYKEIDLPFVRSATLMMKRFRQEEGDEAEEVMVKCDMDKSLKRAGAYPHATFMVKDDSLIEKSEE